MCDTDSFCLAHSGIDQLWVFHVSPWTANRNPQPPRAHALVSFPGSCLSHTGRVGCPPLIPTTYLVSLGKAAVLAWARGHSQAHQSLHGSSKTDFLCSLRNSAPLPSVCPILPGKILHALIVPPASMVPPVVTRTFPRWQMYQMYGGQNCMVQHPQESSGIYVLFPGMQRGWCGVPNW